MFVRVAAIVVFVACGSGAAPPPQQLQAPSPPPPPPPSVVKPPASERHVIPNGLVHVVLVDFDTAPAIELDAAAAVARRDEVEGRFSSSYRDDGHERWFFHAFDRDTLEFVIARWHQQRLGGDYTAIRRIRIARSPDAEHALGVADEIAQYERGSGGVRAGMSRAQVAAIKGKPDGEIQLGPFDAFDWSYADACIRFLDGRVARIADGTCGR